MPIELILSGDGSHTLYNSEMNETYHSHHGALQESVYVFIEKGIDFLPTDLEKISLLEIGFGTGLNALLTLLWAEKNKKKVRYHTLEPFPLTEEIYSQLNYLTILDRTDLQDSFLLMHRSEGGKQIEIGEYFSFTKYIQKLEDFNTSVKMDLIYYDAFAPSKQPEVWDIDNFKKTAALLKNQGVLVSYCASGQFKRNLKDAGYTLESLPGPPGKKEMTRGIL